jgi:hypothetical protein
VEVIPVSSGRKDESCSATKRAAPDEAQDRGQEEAEVTSADKAEATAHDAIVFLANFGDPSDLYATPKAYSTKFFNKHRGGKMGARAGFAELHAEQRMGQS